VRVVIDPRRRRHDDPPLVPVPLEPRPETRPLRWLVTVCVDEEGGAESGPAAIVEAGTEAEAAQRGWEAMGEVDHYGVKCASCEGVSVDALSVILLHDVNVHVMEPADAWTRRT
jgi:hypothetical protein